MENPQAAEWTEPPPPEMIPREEPQMSEVATVGNIFLEPERTFEDLRRKPRFILATIICALLMSAYGFVLYYKIGDSGMRQFILEQIERSPQAGSMSAEQKNDAVRMQMTIQSVGRYISPVLWIIPFVLGGLFYWLGAKAFGGSGGFLHGWSVYVYSSLPPTVVAMIANFIVLAFKATQDIDPATSQRGVVQANLAILMDGKANPVLATLIGTVDLFMIWGWILAAIGLRVTNKLSSGSAWAIVFIFGLLSVLFRVMGSYFSGNPL